MGRKITRKPKLTSKRQKAVSDCNDTDMDKIDKEISEEVKKVDVVKLSDSDDEIDSLFDDCPKELKEEEEEENNVVTLTDSDNEIDALLEEFIEEEINFLKTKSIQNVILSSDDEEMEDMVEEFSKNESKDDSVSCKAKDNKIKKKSKKKKAVSKP